MRSGTEELRCSPLTSPARGAVGLKGTGCSEDIRTYTIALCMVLTWGSLAYLRHTFHPITHLFISFLENMKKLWIRSSKKGDTLAPSQRQISKPSLVLSNLPPSPLFPNWENRESSAGYTTSPTCVKHPQIQNHLSTQPTRLPLHLGNVFHHMSHHLLTTPRIPGLHLRRCQGISNHPSPPRSMARPGRVPP